MPESRLSTFRVKGDFICSWVSSNARNFYNQFKKYIFNTFLKFKSVVKVYRKRVLYKNFKKIGVKMNRLMDG